MDKKENNENNTPEEEIFKEDNKKNIVLRAVITACVFLILLAGVAAGVLSANRGRKKSTSLEESIERYADEDTAPTDEAEGTNGPEATVIDRNDDTDGKEKDETAKAKATPSPTPEIVPTPSPEVPVMEQNTAKDYSKIKFDSARNLKEMEGYFNEDNAEALHDLAYLDRYIAMSYSLRDTKDFIYYGDVNADGEPDGTGIAVYADNEYYCGEWKDGVRSGSGRWVHYHIHLTENTSDPITFHQYTGTFANDLPNGAGQDHYEYDMELLDEDGRYITNYICSYKDGLIDGEVYCTTTGKNGEYLDWTGTAKAGSFLYISEARDSKKRGPVLVDRENSDNYLWMSAYENQKIGVKNYISERKE